MKDTVCECKKKKKKKKRVNRNLTLPCDRRRKNHGDMPSTECFT
jgi:hypothetical protein